MQTPHMHSISLKRDTLLASWGCGIMHEIRMHVDYKCPSPPSWASNNSWLFHNHAPSVFLASCRVICMSSAELLATLYMYMFAV